MAKHEQNRNRRIFHTVVAILILISGAIFFGLGCWLSTTKSGDGLLNLDFSGQSLFMLLLSLNVVSIVIGLFLLFTGVISLIALARGEGTKCVSVTFRIWYIVCALLIFIALISLFGVSTAILYHKHNKQIRDFVREAWKRTVDFTPNIICNIENRFKCRGFESGDCSMADSTANSLCATCGVSEFVNADIGCYTRILERLKDIFIPMAIVSGLLSLLILIDIFVTCFL